MAGEAARAAGRHGRHRPGRSRGCWSCRSRATATCGSPSPPNSPRSCCRYVETASARTRRRCRRRRNGDDRRAVRRRAAAPRAQPGRRRVRAAAGPLHPVPAHRRAVRRCTARCRCSGRWLTFFAERAEYPGSCAAAGDDRGCSACTGRPGRAPLEDANLGRAARLDRPAAGLTGAEAAARRRGPAALPAGRAGHRPGLRQRDARPADRRVRPTPATTRRRQRPSTALRARCARQLRADLAADVAGGRPAARPAAPARVSAQRWATDRDAFTGFTRARAPSGGPPQPRRDGAVAAARRLDRLERAQAGYDAQRALDDPLVMAEYRLTGEAFAGTVVAASRPGSTPTASGAAAAPADHGRRPTTRCARAGRARSARRSRPRSRARSSVSAGSDGTG